MAWPGLPPQASGQGQLSSGLLSGMMAGELGGLRGGRGARLGPAQVQTCHGGFPPDSGREPGFLRRKPEERAPGALPPGPHFNGPLAARSFWG